MTVAVRRCVLLAVLVVLPGLPGRAVGGWSSGGGCRTQIAAAEAAMAIPSGLLAAIGSVESGMDPLAVNADGVSYRSATPAEAVALVRSLQRSGARYVDVGCLQIDLFYHPAAFATLEQAFDPAANVAYGASLLARSHAASGDWSAAVAGYHSRHPARGAAYLRRVAARYAPLAGRPDSAGGGARPLSESRAGLRPVTVRLSFMTVMAAPVGR